MYQSCNRRLIPSMASSTLRSPSAISKPSSLHCEVALYYSPLGRSSGLQCGKFPGSSEKIFKSGFALSSPGCTNGRYSRCYCRASFCFRAYANSALMVYSLLRQGAGCLKVRTFSSPAASSRDQTRIRASSTSLAPSPKKNRKEIDAEIPAIHQPSLTWGIVPHSEEGKQKVMEFLEEEGIDTSELHEVELPNTIEVMQERLHFLKKLGLSMEAINSYPLMVTCSIKKNLIPVLDYLEQLGLRPRDLPTFVEKYPMVLHSSVIVDLMPVVDYLLGLDIQRKDIIKVLARYPDVLGFRLEGTMSTSVAYLVSLGVRMRCIGHMLTEYPEILGMRVAKSIKPKVDFFACYGVPKPVVARLLEPRPYILGFDLSETMEPVVYDLLEAGVRKEGIASIITQYPDILGQGISENLNRKTEWLVKQVKVEAGNVPVIIEKLPQILFIKEGLAMERVKFFKNAGCSAIDVAKMVTDCPQILALNIAQAIEPSLKFLLYDMKRSIKEIVAFPAYFTYDLKSRIMPRYAMIAKKGVDCSLEWFLNCTDQRFRERLSAEYLDDDDDVPGPVFQMGGIVHTELKLVEEAISSEEELDLEINRQHRKREEPRSSPAQRRETAEMHHQQRDSILETASDVYSQDDDTDHDTDDARAILRSRVEDDDDLEELESASEFVVSEEEEERNEDDDEDEWDMPETVSKFDESGEDSDDDDDGDDDDDDGDSDDEWEMPETVSRFDESGEDSDDDDDDDFDSDKVSEEDVQPRAINKRRR